MRDYVFIFFYCLLCYLLRTHFPILLFARAHIIVLYSDVGRKLLLTVTILFSLPILTFVQ